MADAYTHPRRTAEQINIWWSDTAQAWITCAWLPSSYSSYSPRDTVYKKERHVHPTYTLALKFVQDNYAGGRS